MKDRKYLYKNFKKEYKTIEYGEGVYLYDTEGNCYLDAAGGVGVVNCGHAVPEIIDKMYAQAKKVSFTYNGLVANEPQNELAERLSKLTPKGMGETRSFFCSGGSEATETALKIAREYHIEKGNISKYKVISRWLSYHGNTIGSLSMTGRRSWRASYEPYMLNFPHISPPYCYRCWYNKKYPNCNLECAHELERVIDFEGSDTISAFIAEPIIGTTLTGVTPPPEYYEIIRSICDKYDVVMIADEVITGIGRTGKNFGIDNWGISPDIIATGKGLSSGYAPLAAVILREKIWKTFSENSGLFKPSFTFAGNPLACSVGVAVLDYIKENDLIYRSEKMGKIFKQKLKTLEEIPIVGDIRGEGLLLGIEFVKNKETKEPFPAEEKIAQKIVEEAFDRGVLIIPGVQGTKDSVNGDHIQITPPYIITEEEIDIVVNNLRDSILAVSEGRHIDGC